MIRIFSLLAVTLIAVTAFSSLPAMGQDPAPTDPPDTEVVPAADPLPEVDPLPTVDPEPAAEPEPLPPEWTYERQVQNPQGTVTNTHRYLDAPEEGRYVREHVVTNPHGEMTQTWERVKTEDGYEYRRIQTWTSPDGTPLRQHERALSGTDPYNYTREHNLTLPDGRTIDHTQVRSWDGETGTMERSFAGPNGQTRQTQRDWSPYELAGEGTLPPAEPVAPSTDLSAEPVAPSIAAPVATATTTEAGGTARWWERLNPFGKGASHASKSSSPATTRRGFSVGTPHTNSSRAFSFAPGENRSAAARQNGQRPWWAGSSARATRRQGPPSHANGISTASRPNPGNGRNR